MPRIPQACTPVNARAHLSSAISEAEASVRRTIELRLNQLLVAIVSQVLGRPHHQRRKEVAQEAKDECACCRCSSRTSQRFSRNGYRKRHLLTCWGEFLVELPRVVCECGGSVRVDFGDLLRPYQRVWDDVDAQIRRWAALALSLRQMRSECARMHVGPLALRTLNQRLHQLADHEPDLNTLSVPPILQVDAIWVTIMRHNGRVRRDRKGRKRAGIGRYRCPIFIAMGIWPETDRSEILLWRLGNSEGADEWLSFLNTLAMEGIHGENGLKLIIHDGGGGLRSALRTVYFQAYEQRCLFHKLRNIHNAIIVPENLTPKQGRRRRKAILKRFRAIWEARRYGTALRRYLKVVRAFRQSQPKAVATLRRDFRSTVTYYHLEKQFPSWERRHLRTTSRLERFNRTLRRRSRAANAFHSDRGVLAMVNQEVTEFHAAECII